MLKFRIVQYLEYKGVSKYECYKNTGISNGVLSQSGGMSAENTLRFISYYNDVNTDWLITGKGEMLKPVTTIQEEEVRSETITYKNNSPKSGYTAVPVVDVEAAAGFGVTNADYIDQSNLIYFPDTMLHGNCDRLCIGLTGESMMPTLQEGTQIVVRRLRRADWDLGIENGKIYVVTNRAGETFVKRIKNRLKSDGVITLVSDNPNQRKYKPFDITADELHHIWATELFISDTVVNCADYISTGNDISELREKVANLSTTVDQLVEKVK